MANWRIQVANYATGALPEDYFVNTIYATGDAPANDAAWQAILAPLVIAFNGVAGGANGNKQIKVYNMADAKPRPIIAQRTFSATGSAAGPTQVALCLSYFSTRNLPRFRGRLYIGPFSGGGVATLRPSTTQMNSLISMGQAIKAALAIGSLVWSIHSVKDNDYLAITDLWVDDSWDTQRRRAVAPTTRVRASI